MSDWWLLLPLLLPLSAAQQYSDSPLYVVEEPGGAEGLLIAWGVLAGVRPGKASSL